MGTCLVKVAEVRLDQLQQSMKCSSSSSGEHARQEVTSCSAHTLIQQAVLKLLWC
jgi:hypothetical protein